MRLHQTLVLEQARLDGIAIKPTKEDPIVTLAVRASLTRDVADTFGCRELIYAGDVPRSGVGKMDLDGEEIDCQVRFSHDNIAFDAVANSVGHFVAKMEGDGVKLLFRIKLTGYAATAADLADKVKADPLEITLKPAQQPLELADGDEVLAEESDSGQLISTEQAADAAVDDGPSLAPAALVGGTHQKKRGRQPKPEPLAPAPEEEPDFMEEIGIPEAVN